MGLLTSSAVSTNLPQASVIFSSVPSATAVTSGDSTTLPRASSDPSRLRSPRLQLGPIVGGVVAALAIILIFIFLLLKHRASQREIRLRAAEIDPTPTPLNVVDTREGLGRHVSVNGDGLRFEMPSPTVYSSEITPQTNAGLKRVGTNYTVLSPIHDEGIDLTSEYTSDADPHAGSQSNSSPGHDLISNGAITEEMSHTPTYILPGQGPNETHLQTDFTDVPTDYAPPAYDSLPTRVNSS